MSNEIILIICLSILLFILIGISVFLFIKINKNKNDKLNKLLKSKIDECNNQSLVLSSKILNLEKLNKEELEKEFFLILEEKNKKKIKEITEEAEQQSRIKSAEILLNAIEHMSAPYIQNNSTSSVEIEDEQIKGRIIGKNGRNKKTFERLTGVDLVIEKDMLSLTVCSHNPIRREIAKLVLIELLKSKVIEPSKIEVIYESVVEKFEFDLIEIGRNVVEDILKIYDLPKDIYQYVGKLKFRSSYGQNSLDHSIECARVANVMAKDLGVNVELATKCAFLHDIGKSNDYELNETHIESGLKIARKLNLQNEIINSIESHHGQVLSDNIYSAIAKIADTVSASRPGARLDSFNEYFERVVNLEKIVNNFEQVTQCYAIKSGRQLRVIVNPSKVLDNELENLALKIKEKLESDSSVSGYNIKVVIIKENRYEFVTNSAR
ncbi:MAG: HDIG domain-containing metalloprotein [Mycoplasma sp.]